MSRGSKPRSEDYLATIYRLEESVGFAKITDISKELGVRPATASKVIKKLEEKNWVKWVKYKYVELTSEGRRLAEQIIRRHRIAEVFLFHVLGFNEIESHQYAHYLEHLPEVVIERMFIVAGKPHKCPHGNAIPGNTVEPEELVNLTNVNIGQICIVKRISGEFMRVLTYLYNTGIKIDEPIKIVGYSDKGVLIKLDNNYIEIPMYFARFVFVRC